MTEAEFLLLISPWSNIVLNNDPTYSMYSTLAPIFTHHNRRTQTLAPPGLPVATSSPTSCHNRALVFANHHPENRRCGWPMVLHKYTRQVGPAQPSTHFTNKQWATTKVAGASRHLGARNRGFERTSAVIVGAWMLGKPCLDEPVHLRVIGSIVYWS